MAILILINLLFVFHAAIIDNCLRSFQNIETQKNICLQCRDGFFLRLGNCIQCNKIIRNAECLGFKAFNYGSNIVTANPTASIFVINNMKANQNESSQNAVGAKAQNASTDNNITEQKNASFFHQKADLGNQSLNNTNQSKQLNSLASKTDGESGSQSLENCKQLSPKFLCLKCFIGYEVDLNGGCKKKDYLSIQKKLEKCLVFSEIESQCFICQDGYELNLIKSICQQNGSAPTNFGQVEIDAKPKNVQKIQENSGNAFTYAKVDNVIALSIKQNGNLSKQAETKENYDTSSLNILKNINMNSSTEKKTIQINLKEHDTAYPVPKNFIQTQTQQAKPNPTLKIILTIEDGNEANGSYFIKTKNESCIEFVEKKGGTECSKCSPGYLLNILEGKCLPIGNHVDLNKRPSEKQQRTNQTSVVINEEENLKAHHSVKNISPPSQNKLINLPIPKQQNTATTITIVVTNTSPNGTIINISTNSTKQAQTDSQQSLNSSKSNNNVSYVQNSSNSIQIQLTKGSNTSQLNNVANISLSNQTNQTNNLANFSGQNLTNLTFDKKTKQQNLSNLTSTSNNTVLQNFSQTGNLTATNSSIPINNSQLINKSISGIGINSISPSIHFSLSNATNNSNVSVNNSVSVANNLTLVANETLNNSTLIINQTIASYGVNICGQKLAKCVKYKDALCSQCIQCDTTFQVYLGKCYDAFSYRLILKTKIYGQV